MRRRLTAMVATLTAAAPAPALVAGAAQAATASDPVGDVRFVHHETGETWTGRYRHDLVEVSADRYGKRIYAGTRMSGGPKDPQRLVYALAFSTDRDRRAEFWWVGSDYRPDRRSGVYRVTQVGLAEVDCHWELVPEGSYDGVQVTLPPGCGLGTRVRVKGFMRDDRVPGEPGTSAYDRTGWSPVAD